MKVKGLNSGSVCFGVGYDAKSDICAKLCVLSNKCSTATKEFLLREHDEIQRQKEGISSLQLDYDSLNKSKRHKKRKFLREHHSSYSPDIPEDFYKLTAPQLEALAESRGLKISEAHLKLKFEKPHLYEVLLRRRVRATYKLGKRNSKSNDEYQEFLRNQKGETT